MSSNKKQLSKLYFKTVAEKELIRRNIERGHEPVEHDIVQYTQLDNLIDNLRHYNSTLTHYSFFL